MSDPHQNAPEDVQAANRMAQASGQRNMSPYEMAEYARLQGQGAFVPPCPYSRDGSWIGYLKRLSGT